MCLCLDLPLRSHNEVIHFQKINWFPVSGRIESCMVTTAFKHYNGIIPSYIHDIFKPSSNKYNTGSQMALDIRKINTGEKSFTFLETKIWTKINHSAK